ncbi:hypothetical protein IID20_04130 [Patescibacteria group bacterium]|nr:hypothetical protein [Patescibacteria group bacterium]
MILILPSFAQSQNPLSQNPLDQLNRAVEGTLLAERDDLPVLIIEWITRILQLVSLVLVILLISGGFIWMTSGGSEEKVKKAKGIIKSAIIGLIIIILSYSLTTFVIGQLTGATEPSEPEARIPMQISYLFK